MKKLFAIFILCSVILSCTACNGLFNTSIPADVWDGSCAEAFGGGNGSDASPYTISNCAQLAYLANEVNEGNTFEGKYFILTSDLDLNNINWTPIGNGLYSFSGSFDGRGHTVKNLNISKSTYYEREFPDHTRKEAFGGLFGTVKNAKLKNLTIDRATIVATDDLSGKYIYVGVLTGLSETDRVTDICDIKITNAKFTSDFSSDTRPMVLYIGGVLGAVHDLDANNSDISITRLHAETEIFIDTYEALSNLAGGLIGYIAVTDDCNIENCASYVSISIKDTTIPLKYYFGAIAAARGLSRLSNVFSKVNVNKICGEPIENPNYPIPKYYINAIFANLRSKDTPGNTKFKNIFGYVEQKDEKTGEKVIIEKLYDIPENSLSQYTQENCKGCQELPDNHGFNTNIWDVSNIAKPKIR